ncbi:MAG: hypothetical protein HND39_08455 [Ignavibacteriota bacterium]|jgi:cell division protein FtsB|nr:MAG: hypothetical protein EDM72_00850 [Chlorobiota bacterium]MBE7476307.1 hypothetical protein [Ignavibacteriales bacterium]MBL1124211.1 hypothetical protein [Ignavibacteriota bacterium]MBV6420182.1 hypothetical protein [Ignavibacteriaceae bacterium]MEB2297841.1 hypothetical protein [Ignavibacteria bacterium]
MKYYGGTILVFFMTKQKNFRSKKTMGMTELIVIAFLAVLGFLAYNNSKKVSRELKKLGADKY